MLNQKGVLSKCTTTLTQCHIIIKWSVLKKTTFTMPSQSASREKWGWFLQLASTVRYSEGKIDRNELNVAWKAYTYEVTE